MGDVEREAARENPGVFERDLELFRHRFERGEYHYAVHAVRWCANFGIPLPDWLEAEACAAMEFYFRNGGSDGQGRGGGHLAKTRRAQNDLARYNAVELEVALGATLEQAFERAHVRLRTTTAQAAASTIEDSYYKIARHYPRSRRKPGPKPRNRNSPGKIA